jgi:hypothetical protein
MSRDDRMKRSGAPIPHGGCCCHGVNRREVLRWGLLGAAAWVLRPALDVEAALSTGGAQKGSLDSADRTLRPLILRYAASPDNPWAMMHGVRAIGKSFSVGGDSAVGYLSSHDLKEQTEGSRRYVRMPIAIEGHQNTFLKTILEAGVSLNHPITAAGRRRTVANLLDDARAAFSYESGKINGTADDLAWSIIAFSITTPPGKDEWKNARGQRIKLREVVRYGFETLEWACTDFRKAMQEGRIPAWKDRISNFTCGGTHLIYSLGVAVRYGHLGGQGRERYAREIGLLIWRLRMDLRLLDEYYKTVAKAYPGKEANWRPYEIDGRLKFLGHAFEILSYNRLNRLVPLTTDQEREVQWAREQLAETVQEVKRLDLGRIRQENRKLFNLLIGDACHAYHGIHMVPGENQV